MNSVTPYVTTDHLHFNRIFFGLNPPINILGEGLFIINHKKVSLPKLTFFRICGKIFLLSNVDETFIVYKSRDQESWGQMIGKYMLFFILITVLSGVLISGKDTSVPYTYRSQLMDQELESLIKQNNTKLKTTTLLYERREHLNSRVSNRIVRLHSLSQKVVTNIKSKEKHNGGILKIIFNYFISNRKSLV